MTKNSYKLSLWIRKDDWVSQKMETGLPVELTYSGGDDIIKKSLTGSKIETPIPLTQKFNCTFKCLAKEKENGKIVIFDVVEFNSIDLADKPYLKTVECLELINQELLLLGDKSITTSTIFKTEAEKLDCQRKSKFNKWKGIVFKKINEIKSLNDTEVWWQHPFHLHAIVKKANINQPELYILDENGMEVKIGILVNKKGKLSENAIVEVNYVRIKEGEPFKAKFVEQKSYKNISEVSKKEDIEFLKPTPSISGVNVEEQIKTLTGIYLWSGIKSGFIIGFSDYIFYSNKQKFRTNPANTLAYSAYRSLLDDSILSIAETLRADIFNDRLPLKVEEMLNDGFVPHRNVIGHPATTDWDKEHMQKFYDEKRHHLDNKLFMLIDYDLEMKGAGLDYSFCNDVSVLLALDNIFKCSCSNDFLPNVNTHTIQVWVQQYEQKLKEFYLKTKSK